MRERTWAPRPTMRITVAVRTVCGSGERDAMMLPASWRPRLCISQMRKRIIVR